MLSGSTSNNIPLVTVRALSKATQSTKFVLAWTWKFGRSPGSSAPPSASPEVNAIAAARQPQRRPQLLRRADHQRGVAAGSAAAGVAHHHLYTPESRRVALAMVNVADVAPLRLVPSFDHW